MAIFVLLYYFFQQEMEMNKDLSDMRQETMARVLLAMKEVNI